MDRIIHPLRAVIARRYGPGLLPGLVFRYIISYRPLYDLAIRFASWTQRLFGGRREGAIRHLPFALLERRKVPEISSKPALKRLPERIGEPGGKPRVGFFLGCAENYILPEVAEAAIRVIAASGAEIFIPKDQVCCGAPALAFGDMRAVEKLAAKNLRAFERFEPDCIVTACATCGKTLKLEHGALADRYRIADIAEFVAETLDWDPGGTDLRVGYHDPCHLLRVQGIGALPRRVLQDIGRYRELPLAGECCGNAGTFSLLYPHFSRQIFERKRASIERAGLQALATGCPGCIMQLRTLLGSRIEVIHWIELLDRACVRLRKKESEILQHPVP
jgi:glycolate oxidase iron-sulfur subunit